MGRYLGGWVWVWVWAWRVGVGQDIREEASRRDAVRRPCTPSTHPATDTRHAQCDHTQRPTRGKPPNAPRPPVGPLLRGLCNLLRPLVVGLQPLHQGEQLGRGRLAVLVERDVVLPGLEGPEWGNGRVTKVGLEFLSSAIESRQRKERKTGPAHANYPPNTTRNTHTHVRHAYTCI